MLATMVYVDCIHPETPHSLGALLTPLRSSLLQSMWQEVTETRNYLISCALEAEEMAEYLKIPIALTEGLDLIPSTHKAIYHHL